MQRIFMVFRHRIDRIDRQKSAGAVGVRRRVRVLGMRGLAYALVACAFAVPIAGIACSAGYFKETDFSSKCFAWYAIGTQSIFHHPRRARQRAQPCMLDLIHNYIIS